MNINTEKIENYEHLLNGYGFYLCNSNCTSLHLRSGGKTLIDNFLFKDCSQFSPITIDTIYVTHCVTIIFGMYTCRK